MKCFGRIAHDLRKDIIFDLLHVLPPAIRITALPDSSAILLSEVLFLLITKLREARCQAYLLSCGDSLDSSALPEERTTTLLCHILDCIMDKNRQGLVRENIYTASVNFFGFMHGECELLAYRRARTSQSAGCTGAGTCSSTGRGAWHGTSGGTGTGAACTHRRWWVGH
ncbi:hypothetical protein DFH11DRAFT_958322 [Phellopilus nigrolimitatus]|nr:hypothetical protein DFH11DRAFT_958322 [Phellopilus nigrolimitatus]